MAAINMPAESSPRFWERGRGEGELMQALVYHAPRDIRLETIDVPACGPGELRLRVDACAVCGTDLKTWHNGNPRIAPPRVMGHEFTGLVETVGEGVQRVCDRRARRHGHLGFVRRVLLLPTRLEQPLHRVGPHGLCL